MQPSFLGILLFAIVCSLVTMGLILLMVYSLIAHENFGSHFKRSKHNDVLMSICIISAWMTIIFIVMDYLCIIFLGFTIKDIWAW